MAVVGRSPTWHPIRIVLAVVLAAIAMLVLVRTAKSFSAPQSPLRRYRDVATAPRVLVRGTVRSVTGSTVPPLCSVTHERWGKCGKSKCWNYFEGMSTAQGELDVTWSSSALPSRVELGSPWAAEPERPGGTVVERSSPRFDLWKKRAQHANLGFTDANLSSASSDRIVERCIEEGEDVFAEGCVEVHDGHTRLGPCPGAKAWGLVRGGDPQPAIDAEASNLALLVSCAFALLLVAARLLVPTRGVLVEGLAARVATLDRGLGISWVFVAVIPSALFVEVLLHGSQPPSTWATGRAGYTLAVSILAGWAILTRWLVQRRREVKTALSPVLETERSPLAAASGTVELAVRARRREDTPPSLLGDRPVAFSEARLSESFSQGKNAVTVERGVVRSVEALEVIDESGEGLLHLGSAILDVTILRATFKDAPPRAEALGVALERHPNHLRYMVEEKVIYDGDPLYVMGDVSDLVLRPEATGYRAVRGSPTLGGDAVPPVLVFAGDERGLIASLEREARAEHWLTVLAGCAAGLLSAVVAFLASL